MLNFSKIKMVQKPSPPLIVIYGGPGIGKTAFGIGASAKTNYKTGKEKHFLVNLDYRGADRLECNRASDLLGREIRTLNDIKLIFKNFAEQEHNFSWIIFDDLSTLEEMLVNDVCETYRVDDLKKIEYGRGYELARTNWLLFFSMIKDLQIEKSIGIILIGHTKIDTQKDPMVESYSKHDLQLDKRSREIVKKSVDLIGFAHKKVHTKEISSAFGKKENVAVGKSERVLTFAPDLDGFESKDRFNMPEEIILDWDIFEDELLKTINNKKEKK